MKIIIVGSEGEGKTTVAKLISETLEKKGIKVDLKDLDSLVSDGLQEQRLEILKDKLNVEIETIQQSAMVGSPRRIEKPFSFFQR